jgi:hypothetical protein
MTNGPPWIPRDADPDRADLKLETTDFENDAVVIAGLGGERPCGGTNP